MRIKTVLALLVATMLVAPVFAESPFVGKWTATATTPGGPVTETVIVSKTSDGYSITATPTQAFAEGQPQASPGKDIVLDADRFSYKRVLNLGGSEVVITYTGVIAGNTFTGEAEIGGNKIPYTGVRIM